MEETTCTPHIQYMAPKYFSRDTVSWGIILMYHMLVVQYLVMIYYNYYMDMHIYVILSYNKSFLNINILLIVLHGYNVPKIHKSEL